MCQDQRQKKEGKGRSKSMYFWVKGLVHDDNRRDGFNKGDACIRYYCGTNSRKHVGRKRVDKTTTSQIDAKTVPATRV
jgi:hypothetical protein